MTTRSRFDTNGASPRERGCALVTGAGRGIGAAIARELAAAGWPVAVNYSSDEDGAGATAEAISEAGGRAMVVCADVAEGDAVDAMFEQVEDQLGPALVLVNNAGIRNDRLVGGLAPDSWERVVDVNLSGAYNTIHRGLGGMVRARFGRVVNISTISAARPLPGQSAYAASKAGIEGLTRTVALEVARRGVTVNAIEPGLVATDFVPEMTEEWAQVVPAKRTATPAEIAAVVRFLVSDEAAYITGAVIPVDGGLSAGLGVFGRPAVGAAS